MNDVLSLLKMFCLSLGLTLVLEGLIALLFKLKREDLLLFVLVNLLTNPAVVFLNMILGGLFPEMSEFLWQVPLEMAVIAVEGGIYARLSRTLLMPWLFAASANVFSYAAGLIISLII